MKFFNGIGRLCEVIVGSVFFVAGTLKLIDPVGAGLVVTEYFKFFHVAALVGIAKPVGVAMAFLESIVGAALVSGFSKKTFGIIAAGMTLFFTVLTAILAIFNPHMDCGCFGEAVHLSHIQTFLKNVVLCVLVSLMLAPNHKGEKRRNSGKVSFALAAIATVFLTIYSLLSLPMVDFTPFGMGAELAAAKGEGAAEEYDQYSANFVYEKDGVEKTFTLEDLPDSTWTFVRTETFVVEASQGETTTSDLSFTDAEGEYRSEDIIDGDVLVVSSYKPEKISAEGYSRIASLLTRASDVGFKTAFIVATDPFGMEKILYDNGTDQQSAMTIMSSTYFGDYKTLITVNRSNGGATWFRDGQVMTKYANLKLPARETLEDMISSEPIEKMLSTRNSGRLLLQGYFLYTFAVMLLI